MEETISTTRSNLLEEILVVRQAFPIEKQHIELEELSDQGKESCGLHSCRAPRRLCVNKGHVLKRPEHGGG